MLFRAHPRCRRMSEFVFDEEKHWYYLDGRPLVSVTRVIKPLYDFSAVHPDVLRRAGEYGTALHKACELSLLNDLDEEGLDENLKRPLEGFRKWAATELNGESYVCEKRMFHPRLKFAGTADIIIDGQAVIDIKSRAFNPITDPLQLVAYEHLWMNTDGHSPGPYKHYTLELKQSGEFVFTSARKPKTWEKFRYLLDYFNMGKEIERWK